MQSVSGSKHAQAVAAHRMRPAPQNSGRAGGQSRPGTHKARRLRVLIITDTVILGAGGSERFLRNLLEHLPRAACEVDVLQLRTAPPRSAAVAVLNLPHVHLLYCARGALYSRKGLAALMRVRRMIRSGGYDVVHSQHEVPDLICALLGRRAGRPRVLSNRRDMGFQKTARMRWLMRKLDHRFDRIVAPSHAILAALPHARSVRQVCIPNGVDVERFAPVAPALRARLREELGCAPNELVVGCVAGLNPVKRHADLIDAFALVHSKLPQARLLLVGEGRMRHALEARIASRGLQGTVHLLGERRDISRVLPALDLFALASESEGMSNAILEAQSCGLAVVATHVGGNPELVNADCGVLVEPGNPTVLAEALLQLLPDAARRMRMGVAARARVLRNHSLQAMANAYLALYRELADAR